MSVALYASNLKSLRFQRLFFTKIAEKKILTKSRHAKSKRHSPIIMQRLKIDLCRKFGIRRVDKNNKKNSPFRLVQHKKHTNVHLLQ